MSTHKPSTRWFGIAAAAVAALAALVLAAVAGWSSVGGTEVQPAASVARQDTIAALSETTTTSTEPTTTTVAEVTTTGPEPPPPPGLGPGDEGEAVIALERKLEALKYDPGEIDGSFDKITGYAVMAFQKVKGMDRSGRATDDVIAAVNATEGTPPALVTGGPPNRVEVDIDRQVLFLYEGGQITTILPVSPGPTPGSAPRAGAARRSRPEGPTRSIAPAGAGRSGRWAASTTRSTSTAAWPSTAPSRCPPGRRPTAASASP